MFKYQNVAKVGERIRSYDFEGRQDCYVEGVVQSVNLDGGDRRYAHFVITVDVCCFPMRRSSGVSRVGTTMYVPLQMGWGEYEGRVTKAKG